MEKMKVRELMRPIDEFVHISNQTTFIEAVEALEKTDQEFQAGKIPQRILLVDDQDGKIVGKLSPLDVVQGLEPNYSYLKISESTPLSRLSQMSAESMKKEFGLWHTPLAELCQRVYKIKIQDFLKMPTPDHMVKADDKMDEAFHLFVVGRHDSLFVQDGQEITGLIRFSDVYRKIRETIKSCPLPS